MCVRERERERERDEKMSGNCKMTTQNTFSLSGGGPQANTFDYNDFLHSDFHSIFFQSKDKTTYLLTYIGR